MSERIEIIYNEYIVTALKHYSKKFGKDAITKWAEDVEHKLYKIKKRLGSEKHSEFQVIFNEALQKHIESGNTEAYKEFVERLLRDYYDPMYDYQIEKSPIPIVFKGNAKEVLAFIKST